MSHSPLLARETGFAPPTGRFSVAPFLRARALTNQPPPQQQTPNKKQALYKLPHIFVVENNKWAIGMNHPRATAPTSGDGEPFIYKKGAAFGMPGVLVDGMDVLKVRFIVFCFYSRAFGRREGGKRDARAVGPGPGCAPPFVPARIPFFFSASSLFGVRFARALPLLPFFCCPFFLLPLPHTTRRRETKPILSHSNAGPRGRRRGHRPRPPRRRPHADRGRDVPVRASESQRESQRERGKGEREGREGRERARDERQKRGGQAPAGVSLFFFWSRRFVAAPFPVSCPPYSLARACG